MKKYFIAAIALTLSLASCDMLDTVPKSTLAPENYFKTETDLQLFSNSFYNNLLDKEPYKHQSDHQVAATLSDEMMGDRTIPSAASTSASSYVWNFENIRKINTLLGHIDQCEDANAASEYTGLAKFFRAYNYSKLVIRYGALPWLDRELDSDDEALYAPRNTREEILDHMIEDIDEAIEKLPDAVSTYRVNKWTALALKADFCLFEGTWRKYHANDAFKVEGKEASYFLNLAADAANQIIAGGKYSLAADYLTLFAEPDADANEYILAIKNDFSLSIYNNCCAYFNLPTQGNPGMTKKFVDSFLMKDGTRFTDKEGWQTMEFNQEVADRDPRLACIIRTPGYKRIGGTDIVGPELSTASSGFQICKYVMDCTLEGVDRASRSFNDMPVYRYAEVLLNYAEAKAELGTLTQEDVDKSINVIRKRAGMPNMEIATLTVDPYLTTAEFGYQNPILLADSHLAEITEIRRERTVELAVEGYRWDDLMRWGEGKCVEQPIYGMYFSGPGEYDLDGDGTAEVLLTLSKKPGTHKYEYVLKQDIILTEGDHGYMIKQSKADASSATGWTEITRTFDENKDYLYPIPSTELVLNTSYVQNPGW